MYSLLVVLISVPFRRLLPKPPAPQRGSSSYKLLEPESPCTRGADASPANNAAQAASAAAEAVAAAEAATSFVRGQTSFDGSGSMGGVAAVAADAAASAAIAAAAAAAAAADSAFVNSRFLLRFQDQGLEASWAQRVLSMGPHKNRKLYFGIFVGWSILHLVEVVEIARMPCESMGWSVLRALGKIALLCGLARTMAVCWVQTDRRDQLHPSASVGSSAEVHQTYRTLECILIVFCFFYAPAQSFPPFAPWPCTHSPDALGQGEGPSAMLAMRLTDFTLQGHTALQLQILLIFLASWLVPTFEMLHFLWCWLLGVHIGWTLAWRRTSVQHLYTLFDIAVRTVLLGAVIMIAITRRFHRERVERLRFLQDLQQRATSKHIFRYLEYMMPAHVIGPMLKSPDVPIAEQVSRVSILFVMIKDFDRLTAGMKPGRLLHFLNEQFVRIDQICAANGVAKIETVREEYVACVGVLPSDKEETALNGHACVLARLVRAAGQILELQTAAVQYQMGIHTGPIVAGVIGRKLPRYRLFGDTMNFAARFMQKGVPGKLQFGTETRRDLLPDFLAQVKLRGQVEMKGKGKVKAFIFEPKQRVSRTTLPELPTFTPKAALSDSKARDFNTRFESALLNVTATEEAQAKRWVLSEKEGFTPQMEASWLMWHNQQFICKSLGRWVGLWVILASILFGTDHSFVAAEGFKWAHWYYGGRWRLHVFVYTRGAALVLMLVLWYACDEWKSWVLCNPAWAQSLIVLACCMVAVLLFLSTDAMVCSNAPEYFQQMPANGLDHAPRDQIFKIVFILLFDSVTRALTPRFFHSLVFVALGVVILLFQLAIPSAAPWFSLQGQLLFVAVVVLNAVGSHQDEQDSRARYKSKCAVELTSARAEQLLDRLMPPLVVEYLRSMPPGAPPPSHEYRHATIAQSDLCDFTQLASQRRPLEVVKFMGDLFGAFDELTDLYCVYKVDTVGDAYIAGMAEEPLTARNSPVSVVNFALDVVVAVEKWARDLGVNVSCRVGVHYGQCIGGIVGKSMGFKLGAESGYQLFGALMTAVELLESTAPKGAVQVSRACREEVDRELQSDTAPMEQDAMKFERRPEKALLTSKGEQHEYSEVGGNTYLVHRSKCPTPGALQEAQFRQNAQKTRSNSGTRLHNAVGGSKTLSLSDFSGVCLSTQIIEGENEDVDESSESSQDSLSEASSPSSASDGSEQAAPSQGGDAGPAQLTEAIVRSHVSLSSLGGLQSDDAGDMLAMIMQSTSHSSDPSAAGDPRSPSASPHRRLSMVEYGSDPPPERHPRAVDRRITMNNGTLDSVTGSSEDGDLIEEEDFGDGTRRTFP